MRLSYINKKDHLKLIIQKIISLNWSVAQLALNSQSAQNKRIFHSFQLLYFINNY